MYSTIKSIQLLTALLKKYNINKLVLSPGGSDIPIIHSLENDDFFECHSVVDERSAVYYGIGLAQQTKSPVACICTSGTAVSNYLPGMTEAFYQDVPIVAITADKDPYRLNQLMLQKTQQVNIFESVTKNPLIFPLCVAEMTDGTAKDLLTRLFRSLTITEQDLCISIFRLLKTRLYMIVKIFLRLGKSTEFLPICPPRSGVNMQKGFQNIRKFLSLPVRTTVSRKMTERALRSSLRNTIALYRLSICQTSSARAAL